MKCPKCGKELEEGQLLCPDCGEEIFIVPDFFPEEEYELVVDYTPLEEGNTEDAEYLPEDYQEPDFKEHAAGRTLFGINLLFFIPVIVIFLILASWIGVLIYRDNSAIYQMKMADRAYENQSFNTALGLYLRAESLDPGNKQIKAKIATNYEAMSDIEMAVSYYKKYIELDSEDEYGYLRIIELYKNNELYDKLDDFLTTSGNKELREGYKEYLVPEVVFSHDSGSYDRSIDLKLESAGIGTIYYTVDGSNPSEFSEKYSEPIELGKGDYTIRAIFENKYGVFSSISSGTFSIMEKSPEAPEISVESGTFNIPTSVTITAPSGSMVYYTLDGTEPDETSRIYGEPVSLPEGDSTLCAIAINSEGYKSDIVERQYSIHIESLLSKDECREKLIDRLVEVQYILDREGTLAEYPGKYIYLYVDMYTVNDIPLYCFNEYYVTTSRSKDMSSKVFGVNFNTGEVYRVEKDGHGVLRITSF